ncbi:F-box/kelch-repeat protein At3g06240-like [Malus sylvestris]|uniref:F-box/kelch-repeat protein At3g06240-like n=1 Tax=Malus sylvestris TaxID=3752 RepID=UPI0021ABB127|nr:F-box/kelch-repeat protein At3g06240-like [Malus sylvestris]
MHTQVLVTLINSPSFVAKHLSNSVDNKFSSSTCILLNRSQVHVFPDKSWKHEVLWSMINFFNDRVACTLYYGVEDLNIPFTRDDHQHVLIHGYCNGIVCVISGKNILLCNPVTREFRQLPDSFVLLPSPLGGKFDLENDFGGLGFGYDCRAKDYKVVPIIENCEYSDDERTYYHRIPLPHTTEVYTMATNSWNEIKIDISSKTYPCSCSVYLNGFCYWFTRLSFDLGDERFHRIQLPSRRESGFEFYYIFLCNESIASFCSLYDRSEDSKSCEIWVMDDYDGVKSSWTKLLVARPFKGIEKPLTLWKCDELLMIDTDGRVISYNSSIDSQALIYVESIVPIK